MKNNVINFITGAISFISWFYMTLKTPEHGLNLALGALLVLLGFGGKETIKEILQIWKQ